MAAKKLLTEKFSKISDPESFVEMVGGLRLMADGRSTFNNFKTVSGARGAIPYKTLDKVEFFPEVEAYVDTIKEHLPNFFKSKPTADQVGQMIENLTAIKAHNTHWDIYSKQQDIIEESIFRSLELFKTKDDYVKVVRYSAPQAAEYEGDRTYFAYQTIWRALSLSGDLSALDSLATPFPNVPVLGQNTLSSIKVYSSKMQKLIDSESTHTLKLLVFSTESKKTTDIRSRELMQKLAISNAFSKQTSEGYAISQSQVKRLSKIAKKQGLKFVKIKNGNYQIMSIYN